MTTPDNAASPETRARDERVLILAPTGGDARLAAASLAEAGLSSEACGGVEELCRAIGAGAGAALIAQEALTPPARERLAATLSRQPPWSDLPLLVLTRGGLAGAPAGDPTAQALETLGNATFLERPLRMATLVRAVRVSLESRRRQYEIREYLRERRRVDVERAALLEKQRAFLRDVLASVTEGKLRLCDSDADLPPRLPDAAEPLALTPGALATLRGRVRASASALDLPRERLDDLVTGASEAAMNAVVHAGGGQALVCTGADAVQVWVQDQGTGISMERLPQATLERGFSSAGTLGHGFWLLLKMADRVWLRTGAGGTTVVLEQERHPPSPAWLSSDP